MKIQVRLSVPAVSGQFDVLIPTFQTPGVLAGLLAKAVEDVTDHLYIASGSELLCRLEDKRVLNSAETIAALGIKNGDHLILI